MSNKQNQLGMTLFDLIIAVLVLGILMSIAVPNMRTWSLNSASTGAADSFVTALSLARTEAVKRRSLVVVCPNATPPLDGCGSNWSNGWQVVVDNAATENSATVTAGDVIRIWEKAPTGLNISIGNSKTFIRFLPSGMLGKDASSPISASLYTAGCTNKSKMSLTIGLGGNISSLKEDCPKSSTY